MKVLVTGGAGFIGTNVVLKLLERGHQPIVIDDLSTGLKSNIPKNVKLVRASIADIDSVRKASSGVDAIVHLAARGSVPRSIRNPIATQKVNVEGTINILEVARQRELQVIFSSSSSVYGDNIELPKTEEMLLKPLTPYAASKLAGEAFMLAYGKTYGMCVTTLRFFNVFGPWQRPDHIYSAVIPKWIWHALNQKPIEVYGDGEQSRDFTSVSIVQEVIVQALEQKTNHPSPINLAFGNRISLNYLIELLKMDFPKLSVQYSQNRVGDIHASQNNPHLINKIFPSLKIETFEDSLRRTINWLRLENRRIVGGPRVND